MNEARKGAAGVGEPKATVVVVEHPDPWGA
jgi:hypothetical protein